MLIRPFTLFCALFAGVSGMVLYAQKHKTTILDKQITKIVYDTQKIKSQTAMLRTEWTLLNQPDRLKDLSTKFTPNLRPLDPQQFVQMASVVGVLPPVQQEPEKDKTREQLLQNVAQNHGQSTTDVATSLGNKAPPIIIPMNQGYKTAAAPDKTDLVSTSQNIGSNKTDNTLATQAVSVAQNKSEKTTQIANAANRDSSPQVQPQLTKKIVNPTVPKITQRKKIKSVDVASSDDIGAPTVAQVQNPPKVVANAELNKKINTSPVQTLRKKAKKIEVADATNAAEPLPNDMKPAKKTHYENVSYNIQSGNAFSHSKKTQSKTTIVSQTDDSTKAGALEKKSAKQVQQNAANVLKRRAPTIKVAKNDAKRSNYSESALGGNSDDALPAPVPFAP